MLRKSSLIFLCFLSHLLCLNAQVNLQTGSATFSLPMFSWQDDKSRLNSVVALNYNSGNGLKVDEVASNVGQGWNLIAGGVITRMQVGEPDDQKAYYKNMSTGLSETVEDESKYPDGYLYNPYNPFTKGCPIPMTYYPLFGDKNHTYKQHNNIALDRELDYFSFQFNGHSGLFVLYKTNHSCLFIGDSKMIGTYVQTDNMTYQSQGVRTTISSFMLTDENGVIYQFDKLGYTKVLKKAYSDARGTRMQKQPHFDNNEVFHENSFDINDADNPNPNPYVVNSWYLTKIKDPFTNRQVTFIYRNNNLNITGQAGNTIAYYAEKNYSIITHKYSVLSVPSLQSINFPDQHQVTFNYGTVSRSDLNGDYALSAVDIFYNGRALSEYQLNTSYFILSRYGSPVTDYQKSVARLCLMSVKKVGIDFASDENPYIFDYYFSSTSNNPKPDDVIPPPYTFLKDNWGFYNGSYKEGNIVYGSYSFDNTAISLKTSIANLNTSQTHGLVFKKPDNTDIILNPRAGFAKNGLLRQIIYPTGGTLTYDYTQNEGILGGIAQYVGGVHVSKTSITDGGYSNGCAEPIATNYNYILNTSGNSSSLWGLEMPNNSIVVNNTYSPEYKDIKFNPLPKIFYHYQWPGILSTNDISDPKFLQQVMQVLSVAMEILNVVTHINDIITTFTSSPVNLIIDIILDVVDIVVSYFVDLTKTHTSTVFYNTDLNANNPLPVQFKRVEVVQNSGALGKTVYDFTSSDDYAIWAPDNPSLSMKQRFAYWAYGLPKKITSYASDGNIVKQTENIYDTTYAKNRFFNPNFGLHVISSCKCTVVKSHSLRDNPDWRNYMIEANIPTSGYAPKSTPEITVDAYDIFTGRTQLITTYERVFKPGSSAQFLQTITSYEYNTTNYQISKVTTQQSNGDVNYQDINYDENVSYTGTLFTTLRANNVFNLPVESSSSIKKSGATSSQYLNEKVTEYVSVSNGDIKPSRILEQRFSQPQSSVIRYSGPNSTSNPPYIETQTFIYDGSSNLVGIKDEGNHSLANIYDYNDKFIAASVINADPILDKSAYTSFETSGLGGWTLFGASGQTSGNAVTGAKFFALSSGKSLSNTLNTLKAYRLSFWSTSIITVTGGATLVLTGPSNNGFNYYEYKIAQGTASITITGNASVDELRIYPENARMRTVTYDPLIGKTSECDENNRITYYEYDLAGRLSIVRDENRNIVKFYEYNTVSNKQSGCPGIYYNRLTSEIFTRSNCSTGFAGDEVLFTVPANKYSSSVSQADADEKAEDEINSLGQNYANNNGACKKIWKNQYKSQGFTTEGCPVGSVGGTVTYSVLENTYSSLIDITDANRMAQEEIEANGQAYANSMQHRICTASTAPDWQSTDPNVTKCEVNSSGTYTQHLLLKQYDKNPASVTYNQSRWADLGLYTAGCPLPIMINVKYANTSGNTAHVELKNLSSDYTYKFDLNPGVAIQTIVGQIPLGNYDVYMYSSGSGVYNYRIYSYFQNGVSTMNVSNVSLCATCASISVANP